LLIVYLVAFPYFHRGSGDTSENGKKVVDSHMKKRLIACDYPNAYGMLFARG
jgi:hypothetical protein